MEESRRIGREYLQYCSSGNLSWRIEDNTALISGTGSWLINMEETQVAICEIDSGQWIGGATPSMESCFHMDIMKRRRDVEVVFHLQSEFATAISCMRRKPENFNVTAEIPCYCGKEIAVIPYLRPGSKELAQAVSTAFIDHDTAILSNHGQVVCGKSFDDALQKALFFEMACNIIIKSGEGNYATLTKKEIDELTHYLHR